MLDALVVELGEEILEHEDHFLRLFVCGVGSEARYVSKEKSRLRELLSENTVVLRVTQKRIINLVH